jgi:hypothetical protein
LNMGWAIFTNLLQLVLDWSKAFVWLKPLVRGPMLKYLLLSALQIHIQYINRPVKCYLACCSK